MYQLFQRVVNGSRKAKVTAHYTRPCVQELIFESKARCSFQTADKEKQDFVGFDPKYKVKEIIPSETEMKINQLKGFFHIT